MGKVFLAVFWLFSHLSALEYCPYLDKAADLYDRVFEQARKLYEPVDGQHLVPIVDIPHFLPEIIEVLREDDNKVYQRIIDWLGQDVLSIQASAKANGLALSLEQAEKIKAYYQGEAKRLGAERARWGCLQNTYGRMLYMKVAGGTMCYAAPLHSNIDWTRRRTEEMRRRFSALFSEDVQLKHLRGRWHNSCGASLRISENGWYHRLQQGVCSLTNGVLKFDAFQWHHLANDGETISLELYSNKYVPADPWLCEQVETLLLEHLDQIHHQIIADNQALLDNAILERDKEYFQNIHEAMVNGHKQWQEWLSVAYDERERLELDMTTTSLKHSLEKNRAIYDWIILLQEADIFPQDKQVHCSEALLFPEGKELRWMNPFTDEIWILATDSETKMPSYQIEKDGQIKEKGDFCFQKGKLFFFPEAVNHPDWSSSRIKRNDQDFSLNPQDSVLAFKYLFLPFENYDTFVKM